MSIAFKEQLSTLLNKKDLTETFVFINKCLTCADEMEFNSLLLSFSAFLKFEFVLYGYTEESYQNEHDVHLVNLSNPEEWATEYDSEGYLRHDPIRHEVERVLATGAINSFILWDNYTWELAPLQNQVVERRNHYGLHHGFSFFMDSESQDFMFVFSFASRKTPVTPRVEMLCKLLGAHLMATRKRLVLHSLTATLSDREKVVAAWVMEGKTNWEIAKILNITINTIKFHIKNIFQKLQVTNRQKAIAVLLAERYLSV